MRAFWLFTWASAVSTMGNTFLYVAGPWALLEKTNSPALAILSVAAQSVPYLLAPLLGPFIDRHDKRWMFAGGEIVQGVAVAAIPLLLAANLVPLVFVALFVLGLANVVSDVAGDYGVIPLLVPRERLDEASSLFTSILLVARFVGPALAGLLIAHVGTDLALYCDAASFGLTAVVAAFMPGAPLTETTHESFGSMFRTGVSFFRTHPGLRRLTMSVAMYNLGAGALESTILAVGGHSWHWSAGDLGVGVSAGAVAAAAGAWLSPRFGGTDRRRRLMFWLVLCAVGAAGLLWPSPYVVLAGFSLVCFGEGGVNAATMSYRQYEIPEELAGRVNAVIRTFITGAVPVSALLLGATAALSSNFLVFLPVMITALLAVGVWSLPTAPVLERQLQEG